MAPPKVAATKKFFSVEEANKALPLVRAIVDDIVRQWRTVSELRGRLSVLSQSERKRRQGDPYEEELAQSKAQCAAEEEQLQSYADELTRLGVELKGPD